MGLWSKRWTIVAIAGALALDGRRLRRRRRRRRLGRRRWRRRAAEDRRLAAAHGRVLRAGQGGASRATRCGRRWSTTSGGLLGRQVELVIKDDASNQNTVVSDYNALISQRQGRPAARHVLVAAQPPGVRGRRAQPDALRRAGRRQPGHLQPRLQDDLLRPAGHGRPPGRRLGEVGRRAARGQAARRRPPTRRSTTRSRLPTSEGIEAILKAAGIETVYRETYTADTTNFDSIANAVKAKNPDLVVLGTQFEDGIGLDARAPARSTSRRKWLYQTNAPSFGDQYADGIGVENTEGVFYAVSHSPEADDAGQRGVRRQVPGDVRRRRRCPRTRPTPTPPARCSRRPWRPTRRSPARTSSSSPTGCARTRSRRSSAR